MGIEVMTALVMAMVPFLVAMVKKFGDQVFGKLPIWLRIILPPILGTILEAIGTNAAGIDLPPETVSMLGVLAGSAGATGRDLFHKGMLGR
mgnify:CR=1 FL=1